MAAPAGIVIPGHQKRTPGRVPNRPAHRHSGSLVVLDGSEWHRPAAVV
jgi:hypothetical protein